MLESEQTGERVGRGAGGREGKILKLQVYTAAWFTCVSKVVFDMLEGILNWFTDSLKPGVR